MATVNDSYPKNANPEISDEQLKELALQQYKQNEVRAHNFPTEIIDLPSKGILYGENHPLHSGKIEMKYMTAREEDILTSQNLIRQGVVLDKLFQSMIVTPINYNDIVVGDKNAIMVAARILGYGKEYECEVTCPACDKDSKHTIDLTTLVNKDVEQTEACTMVAPNRFKVVLPNSKRVVVFRLLTHGIDAEIDKHLAAIKKTAKKDAVDTELTTRLKRLIVSVDDNTDQGYINNFVDNELFAIDSRILRKYIKDVAPDVPFNFHFECPHCGLEEETEFPIGTGFFWPST
jgi:hypothetical protein